MSHCYAIYVSPLHKQVCKQTKAPDFCIVPFGSDPRTATVDLKGLTHISFGVVFVGCLVELKNTRDSETPNLSKASSTAPSNSASLSTRYSNKLQTWTTLLSSKKSEVSFTGIAWDCERAFFIQGPTHSYPLSLLTGINDKFEKLSDISDVIIGLLLRSTQ